MRYVDLRKLAKPDGWNERASTAASAVANGENPNDHDAVWRELKNGLADLLHDKCWYCESSVDRSDNAVDHFRPKNRVSDAAKQHAGYRWLAFDASNFRYACTYCNSRRKDLDGGTAGGKADRFPLLDEAQRVYVAGPTTAERPVLLDPCNPLDWKLLGCQQENGKPCAASQDPVAKQRAEVSIEVYHLDYGPTCTRRLGFAAQLVSDVDEGKQLYEALKFNPDKEAEFNNVLARLLRLISRDALYSGEMRFLLGALRGNDHPWIQELLEA